MAAGSGGQAPPTLRYARQPPPLPRRTPQRGPGWNAETPGSLPGRPAQDDRGGRSAQQDPGGQQEQPYRSGQVRLPSGPDPAPLSATQFAAPGGQFTSPGAFTDPATRFTTPGAQFTAPAALSESDELFRAWQGSVRDAAGPRTRRPVSGARRGRAWQVAKIGVPAVVIVTVGAGALLMLTGRANEMLAERSSTGTARTGQATSTAASMILAGYPGGRGGVTVAAMWSASGTIVAVGMADGHPAIWRRALNGGWPLVSAADLGTMSGHLTSVAHGPSGWIAVGSVTASGVAQPMVYTSADGVTWRTVPSLTAMTRSDAQFLGVAAGPGGYLVVGREGTGKQKFAQLWWSGDLANWTAGGSSGYHNSLAIAAVADGDGFVAAGSQADCHTIWTSPDGMHWTTHDVTRPARADRDTALRCGGSGRTRGGGGLRHQRRRRHPHRGDDRPGRCPHHPGRAADRRRPRRGHRGDRHRQRLRGRGHDRAGQGAARRHLDLRGRANLVRSHSAQPRDGYHDHRADHTQAVTSPAPCNAAWTPRC